MHLDALRKYSVETHGGCAHLGVITNDMTRMRRAFPMTTEKKFDEAPEGVLKNVADAEDLSLVGRLGVDGARSSRTALPHSLSHLAP